MDGEQRESKVITAEKYVTGTSDTWQLHTELQYTGIPYRTVMNTSAKSTYPCLKLLHYRIGLHHGSDGS